MGPNTYNLSGVSWKIWKIEVRGRKVTSKWGAAYLSGRKPTPHYLQKKTWTFKSVKEAKEFEAKRIARKLAMGYERTPRMRVR